MARTIGTLCYVIVGLQILIGVPLVVCAVFFFLMSGGLGPVAVEVNAGPNQPPSLFVHNATIPPPTTACTVTPPPNTIPVASASLVDNPILTSRAQHGSLLAGTVFETAEPTDEKSLFVAALEKVASEEVTDSTETMTSPLGNSCPANCEPSRSVHREQSARLVTYHLYEMAEIDENAGEFDRADQWRALAREIRAKNPSDEAGHSPAVSAALDTPLATK